MTKVLIVEDEPQMLRMLRVSLTARRYDVVTATDAASALAAAARTNPDLVILDLGLPDLDGIEVISGLRGWTDVPIVVLSGRTDSSDKVDALDAGADDYLTKPFSLDELLARLRVARRHADRATSPTGSTVYQIGDHRIDLATRTVTRSDGRLVHLTRTEWGITEVLLRNAGKLVSPQYILAEVWGPGYDDDKGLLRFHMAKLRRKLEAEPSQPRHLITESGLGYRYQA
ncbi:MAG: response regulator [Catenulispora sp.]|nr:response regulator [Catenulispora sp.]